MVVYPSNGIEIEINGVCIFETMFHEIATNFIDECQCVSIARWRTITTVNCLLVIEIIVVTEWDFLIGVRLLGGGDTVGLSFTAAKTFYTEAGRE